MGFAEYLDPPRPDLSAAAAARRLQTVLHSDSALLSAGWTSHEHLPHPLDSWQRDMWTWRWTQRQKEGDTGWGKFRKVRSPKSALRAADKPWWPSDSGNSTLMRGNCNKITQAESMMSFTFICEQGSPNYFLCDPLPALSRWTGQSQLDWLFF